MGRPDFAAQYQDIRYVDNDQGGSTGIPRGETAWGDRPWIVNSRNSADEDAVRTLGSLHGFTPSIRHQIDSLDLVEDLIVAGYGVGLLPRARPTASGVTVLRLADPTVVMTAYAVTRRGRENWSPLRLVLDQLDANAAQARLYAPVSP